MSSRRAATRFVRLGAATLLLPAHSAFATDRLVPSQYPTIREAVDAAVEGDHVVIANGTYTGPDNKNIDLGDKNIVIRSANGSPDVCVIDCLSDGRAFIIDDGQDNTTIIA